MSRYSILVNHLHFFKSYFDHDEISQKGYLFNEKNSHIIAKYLATPHISPRKVVIASAGLSNRAGPAEIIQVVYKVGVNILGMFQKMSTRHHCLKLTGQKEIHILSINFKLIP